METLDTVEVKGVPGVQLMMVGNTTSGAFDFMGKLVKDVGLVEVLRNTSTEFMPQYVPPPEFAPYTGTTTPYVPPAGYTGWSLSMSLNMTGWYRMIIHEAFPKPSLERAVLRCNCIVTYSSCALLRHVAPCCAKDDFSWSVPVMSVHVCSASCMPCQ